MYIHYKDGTRITRKLDDIFLLFAIRRGCSVNIAQCSETKASARYVYVTKFIPIKYILSHRVFFISIELYRH